MSSFLFTLAINLETKHMINQQRTGIRWNLCSSHEDLIYADDLALPSHTRDQVQRKTSNLEQQASSIDLSVNAKKTKVLTNSNLTQQPDTATCRDQQSSTRVRQQVHLPGQHHQSPRRCRRRHQNTIGKSQVSICKSTAALEILSILPKDQTQNLPEQCPLCDPLRLRALAHDTKKTPTNFPASIIPA